MNAVSDVRDDPRLFSEFKQAMVRAQTAEYSRPRREMHARMAGDTLAGAAERKFTEDLYGRRDARGHINIWA